MFHVELNARNSGITCDELEKQINDGGAHAYVVILLENNPLGPILSFSVNDTFEKLRRCYLDGCRLEFFPETFLIQCPVLEFLSLASNYIRELPAKWHAPNLSGLDLQNNRLEVVSCFTKQNFPQMRELYLAGNKLNESLCVNERHMASDFIHRIENFYTLAFENSRKATIQFLLLQKR